VDFRRLSYFVAVAEEQHFGRAAARLHMSAPPLSQRIQELEAELGLPLFERTSRKVSLTAAGERLLPEARAVLKAVERFQLSASELVDDDSLPFAYCNGSEYAALQIAKRFHRAHPSVAVRPAAFTSLRIFEAIRTGRVRAGIVHAPVPSTFGSSLLAYVPFSHVAVPEGHRLAEQDVVYATDLESEPALLVERAEAPTFHDETLAYCDELGVRPTWVLHVATQVERMLDMVSVGTGIGWLNAWQAEHLARDGVVVRPLSPVTRFDELHIVWRKDDPSPAVASFVQLAVEFCRV
jgi:DNA-binding transcriptional LysR family regulator